MALPIDSIINFNMKAQLTLVLLLLASSLALKPSEAGVNDWHLSNIGELKSITFARSKLQYVSALGQIGVLERSSGKVEARFVVPETEKVVRWSSSELTVATRHNQVLTYSFKGAAIDNTVNNHALGEQLKIESYAKAGKKEYFLTARSLTEDKSIIREAKAEEEFIRVAGGVSSNGLEIVILAYSTGSQLCLENYHSYNFHNLYCLDTKQQINELSFLNGKLFLSFSNSTIILNENLEVLYSVEQPLIEVVRGAAVFGSHSWDSEKQERLARRPVWSSREESIISITQSQSYLSIFRDDLQLFKLSQPGATSLLRAWFNHRSDFEYDLLVQFSDLQLVLFEVTRGEARVGWIREESLAYIREVVFMKYNKIDALDNPYHRHLISHAYRARSFTEKLFMVPNDILLRLAEEVTDAINHLKLIAGYILELGSIDRDSLRKFQMSKEQEIKYGLRKYLIAATEVNTLIALDTKTGEVLWKIHNQHEFISLVQLKKDYETENAVLITFDSTQRKIFLYEILETGQPVPLTTLQSPLQTPPAVYKLSDHALLLKSGQKIQRFRLVESDEVEKEYYFYAVSEQEVEGWKAVGDEVVPLWNFRLAGNERVVKTASAFRGHQVSHIPLFDKEKVFFKNVDFTNLAVLTSLNHTTLGLYILNGRTGKVQFTAYKQSVNNALPVNLVYDENNVLVSYFHTRNKYFEIWTIEQYQERIESSALAMITDYISGAPYTPQENREQTIFQSEVYGSPLPVKGLYVSQSKQSLTRRNLFIITRENKLYTINRDFVNTRRPRKDAKDAKGFFSNEKLPEYSELLPFNPTFYLSYDLPLADLRSIVFSPADMESSIFVFCYGTDNFLIRTAPDKTFDMITEDFNYLVLLLILVVGTVAILFFRRRLTIAKLKKPHLE